MTNKAYRFYCEVCNWKKITYGGDLDGLVELPTSPIPGGAPKPNPETGKVEAAKQRKQTKRFKCPQCGRLVIPKAITDHQKDLQDKLIAQEKKEKLDEEGRTYGYQSSLGGPKI